MPELSFSAWTQPPALHYEAIAGFLRSMLDLAESYGGQAKYARRILLSIHSPSDYQMSGDDFAGLDIPHIHHAIHLLHEHGMQRKNIFQLIEDGEERVLRLAPSTSERP